MLTLKNKIVMRPKIIQNIVILEKQFLRNNKVYDKSYMNAKFFHRSNVQTKDMSIDGGMISSFIYMDMA